MKLIRGLLILVGIALVGVGVFLLRKYYTTDGQFVGLGKWLAGAVVLHDAVLAPVVLAIGTAAWWLTRNLSATVRQIVMGGLVTSGVLALVAWPMIRREGKSANPTALTQSYGLNLLWLLLAVAVITAATATVVWRTNRKERIKSRPPEAG